MKILLVEDSKFLRMAKEKMLTSAGYEVISAGDGEGLTSGTRTFTLVDFARRDAA